MRFLLYSAVSQKGQPDTAKRAGLLRGASSMAGLIPMAGMGKGIARMVASTAASSALNGAAEAASLVKAKADVTLEYQLIGIGAAPTVPKTRKP